MKFSLKKFKRADLERRLGFFFLFLLFPGFFFYHTAIAIEVIPSFLGGFFSPISILVIFTLLPVLVWGMLRRREFFIIDFIFWIIIFYWCVILFLYYSFSRHLPGTKIEVMDSSVRGMLANVACYAVGRSLNLESRRLMQVLVASLIVMLLISLVYANEGQLYLRATAVDDESVATYQGFARSALVVGVLVLLADTRLFRVSIVFFASIVLLFLNGARSEFVFFLVAGLVYGWFVVFKSIQARLLSFAVLAPIAIIVILDVREIMSLLPQTRMMQLLDIQNYSSGEARSELTHQAWDIIKSNPLFGSYAAHVPAGGVGSYAHNLLSAWVDLGLPGFFLYILGVLIIFHGGRMLISGKSSPRVVVVLMFAAILAVAYGAAKNYQYMIFGLAVGFHAKALSNIKTFLSK